VLDAMKRLGFRRLPVAGSVARMELRFASAPAAKESERSVGAD